MIKKLARYRIRPETAASVRTAINEFIGAIHREEPDTIYAALAASDGVTFVHAMAFSDAAAEARHRSAPHTRRFTDILYPNCEQQPEFTDLVVIATTRTKPGGFLAAE